MEAKIHTQLANFLSRHALEDCTSNIDEIVLSYLVGVVELVSEGDDATDFEDFLDMMNAYLPGFENIDRADVIEWMFGLTESLSIDGKEAPVSEDTPEDGCYGVRDGPVKEGLTSESESKTGCSNGETPNSEGWRSQKQSTFPSYEYANTESHSMPHAQNGPSHSRKPALNKHSVGENGNSLKVNSSQMKTKCHQEQPKSKRCTSLKPDTLSLKVIEEKINHNKRKGRQLSCSSQESQEDSCLIEEVDSPSTEPCIRILLEMFPSACTMEARHCLQLSGGDMDRAAQLIIDRQESGQAIAAVSKKASRKSKKVSNYKLDDDSIKLSVLQKYSFIDTEDDKKTYRPPPPKGEAKKLVRYRDGQVVSMKGERFSEVKKNTDEMKS